MIKITAQGQGFTRPIEITIFSSLGDVFRSHEEAYLGEFLEEQWAEEIIDKIRKQKLGSGEYAYRYQDIKIEKIANRR